MDRLRPLTLPGTLLLALSQSACGSSGNNGIPGEVGTYNPAASFAGGDAGGGGALEAHIERNHIAVTFLTLNCSGPCADVLAVPTGGQAPYTFKWEDGSTHATRQVCPTSTTSYSVNVTDTGTTGEVPRPPETAQASLTADVIACPDGGASDAGAGLCLSNPSFEGSPESSGFWSFSDPSWQSCPALTGTPDVLDPTVTGVTPPGSSLPAASDGETYVGLLDNKGVANSYVAQDLCAPVPARASRSFRLDAARVSQLSASSFGTDATDGFLEVWGGTSGCDAGDGTMGGALLWTSPELATTWTTYCVTIQPSSTMTSLAFRARADYSVDSATEVLVDHIVPVDTCP